MNILMLTSSYPKYPGETTAPFIEEIAAGMVRRGHAVTVLAPFHPEVRRADVERGVRLRFYRYSPHPALNVYGYAASLRADVGLRGIALAAAPLAATASLVELLRLTGDEGRRTKDEGRRTNDLARSRRSSVVGRAFASLRAGSLSFVPSLRSGQTPGLSSAHRPFDLIHAHWVLPNGVPAAIAARLRGLPLVVSLHGSDVYLAGKAWPLSLAAAAVFRAAGAVTACSGDLYGRALGLGARPADTEVVPYGVDASSFRPDPQDSAVAREELGLAPGTPLVLAIGRMVYKKGFSYLIEAFPRVLAARPDARLVLVGYGDLREELGKRAAELGIAGSVIFPGQLERERAARTIGAADVYVVPSVRDQGGNVDGLPNTLLEGMSAARPIVASRVAGIPDVITDGVHGLLATERDSESLAAAIGRLLDDRELGRALGERARRRVLEELTWDVAAERFERAYERAITSKSK